MMIFYRYLLTSSILFLLISCGSPGSIKLNDPNLKDSVRIDKVDQAQKIENMIEKIRKLQLGTDNDLIKTYTSKNYNVIFAVRANRMIGVYDIVAYDISQDEPILTQTIIRGDGSVLGFYPLDKKRVVCIRSEVAFIMVDVYDYGKRHMISSTMLDNLDYDVYLAPTVKKDIAYFGKGYGVDFSDVDNIRIINIYLNFYRDGLNNVVIDKVNNIMWEDSEMISTDTWQKSIQSCKTMTLSNNNHEITGWRMPTSDELNSIVKEDKINPATQEAFLYTRSDIYWSSTPSQNSLKAYGVNLANGEPVIEYKDQKNYYICVKEL